MTEKRAEGNFYDRNRVRPFDRNRVKSTFYDRNMVESVFYERNRFKKDSLRPELVLEGPELVGLSTRHDRNMLYMYLTIPE